MKVNITGFQPYISLVGSKGDSYVSGFGISPWCRWRKASGSPGMWECSIREHLEIAYAAKIG